MTNVFNIIQENGYFLHSLFLQAVIIWSINYCYCLLQTQAGETLKGMYVIQTWQTTLKKDMNRADRQKSEGKREGEILTKETWRAARRNAFPHQHIMFHKSSKLSCSERKTKMERVKKESRGDRKERNHTQHYCLMGSGILLNIRMMWLYIPDG